MRRHTVERYGVSGRAEHYATELAQKQRTASWRCDDEVIWTLAGRCEGEW
jgi:hypothetical protein